MPLPKERIHFLLEAHISKRATPDEENELMDWILEAGYDSELKNYMLGVWNQYRPTEKLSNVEWDEIYSRVMETPVISIQQNKSKIKWLQVAAAVVVMILASGMYFYFTPQPKQSIAVVPAKQHDIAPPASNKAILTLADGTKIEIDTSGNGTLAIQGNIKIIKQSSGAISYTGSASANISYNTLNVPRGSKPLSLMLADGSLVWLNVGSSLTYPTAFSGNERKVKITGEAYFEVAHNAGMPFVVQNKDVTVHVLGTHFNVNNYEDESDERITLLEGSIQVSKNKRSRFLKPGQQARIDNDLKEIKIIKDVDMDEVMAWKNGKFKFGENTGINAIMRQIGRWYNVDIEYKGRVNQRFWGTISKDVNLSRVLKILEATGGVKFKIEGKKIIVMPVFS